MTVMLGVTIAYNQSEAEYGPEYSDPGADTEFWKGGVPVIVKY